MSEPEPTTQEPAPPVEPTTPEPGTGWQDAFSADMRSNPSFSKFAEGSNDAVECASKMFGSYTELQTTLGADRVAIPGEDAPQEEWDSLHSKMGRPDTVEGYELADWKPPEGVPWNMDSTAEMVKRAHARGLSKSQMQGMLADQAEVAEADWQAHVENVGKQNEQTIAALKAKHGAAFDTKMLGGKKAALALVEKAGLQENPFETVMADGRKVGDLPGMVEVMMVFGDSIGEDVGPGPGARTTRTPDEAQKELNAMLGDEKRMAILTDAQHPEHKALQARKADLERQIYL